MLIAGEQGVVLGRFCNLEGKVIAVAGHLHPCISPLPLHWEESGKWKVKKAGSPLGLPASCPPPCTQHPCPVSSLAP